MVLAHFCENGLNGMNIKRKLENYNINQIESERTVKILPTEDPNYDIDCCDHSFS